MSRCDVINLDESLKPQTQVRETYSSAQKMRAAMTYVFGRMHGLGSFPWHQDHSTGKWLETPSVSHMVSSYMISLRRIKVWASLCNNSISNPEYTQVQAG